MRGTDLMGRDQQEIQGKGRVLIVDDESQLLLLLERQLDHLGYQVHRAEDPRQALALLGSTTFDLLLTDVVMPNTLNGVELAQRAMDTQPELKVLFMTGYVTPDQEQEALAIGPMLHKPFTLRDLDDALGKLLQPR